MLILQLWCTSIYCYWVQLELNYTDLNVCNRERIHQLEQGQAEEVSKMLIETLHYVVLIQKHKAMYEAYKYKIPSDDQFVNFGSLSGCPFYLT